ncbi:MAG: GTPase [Burkholderiaceae bacterium]
MFQPPQSAPVPPVHPVSVTLVVGASAAAREAAIAAAIRPVATAVSIADGSIALILEGFPSGVSAQAAALDPQHNPALAQAARIAPGCLCCIGNLTLKVTLNRILRRQQQSLQRIYISLASASHIAQLRMFLSSPPYDRLLRLTDDRSAD